MAKAETLDGVTWHPVTPERWDDLEKLFGPRGACAGCWCMWWRLTRAQFAKMQGEGNRLAMRAIVNSGEVPGLIAYADGQPIGWVAVAPREAFSALERSRVMKRVDDRPVWSVVCFFVAKQFRRRGLTVRLLEAAVAYAREHGATIVEGYPIDTQGKTTADVYAYTGLVSPFRTAGFLEAKRFSPTRPIMRYFIT